MDNKETLINHIEEHPKLRFKDIDGDFPDWKIKQLNEVCAIVGGGTPDTQKSEYWDGNIEWFTPSEIGFKKYVDKSQRTITKTGLLNSSAKLLPKGTILLSTRATIGEMSISSIECATNQGFHSLVVNNKIANTEYIYYLKNIIKKYCLKYSSGNTFKEINLSMLRKCLIPIPTLQEQQKIASFLSLIDEKIEKQELKLILLNKYKRGVLREIYSNIKEYDYVSLKEISIICNGYAFNAKDYKKEGLYNIITITNVQGNKYIDNLNKCNRIRSIPDNINSYQILNENDILISMTGNVGRVSLNKGNNNLLNQRVCKIDNISKNVNKEYLFQILRNNKFEEFMTNLGKGANQKNISKSDIENYMIKLPDLNIQNKIANILSTYDILIDKEKQVLNLLQEMKSGLLQQMFI